MKTLLEWPAPPSTEPHIVIFWSVFDDCVPRWAIEVDTQVLPYESMAEVIERRAR